MKYITVLLCSEQLFNDLIKDGLSFEETKVLAAIRNRLYDETDIKIWCAEVREKACKLEKEYIALHEFSKIFLRLYATDFNKCYDTAYNLGRKLKSTLAGTKRLYKKMCPTMKNTPTYAKLNHIQFSTFNHSYLAGIPYNTELFGLESYPECVRELCATIRYFFVKLMANMALCRDILEKERYIKSHPDECNKIYKENYEEIGNRSHDLIKSYEKTNAPFPESPICKEIRPGVNMQQDVCEHYHSYTQSQFQTFVIYDIIQKGKKDKLNEVESLLWPTNHELALKVRYTIEHFDELGEKEVRGRNIPSINKHHLKAVAIAMLMEWAGIAGKSNETAFIRYFKATYRGQHVSPAGNSGANGSKGKFSQDEYHHFVGAINNLLSNRREKAQEISLFSYA